MFRKLMDKLVDKIYAWASNYRNKKRLKELKSRDPFIYY